MKERGVVAHSQASNICGSKVRGPINRAPLKGLHHTGWRCKDRERHCRHRWRTKGERLEGGKLYVAPRHALHKFVGTSANRSALYVEEWESGAELTLRRREEEPLERGEPYVECTCVLFVVAAPRWLTSAAELRIAAWVRQVEAGVGEGPLKFGNA